MSGGAASEKFFVDALSGRIILREAVTAGDIYTMRIRAQDGGSPPLNGTVFVTINVIGSQGDLLFG